MPSGFSAPFSLQLPQTPTTKDPKNIGDITSLFNAVSLLQQGLVDYCGITAQPEDFWSQLTAANTILAQNMNRFYPIASENIAAGAIISLHLDSGICKMRNANATNNTKPAHGYSTGSVLAGENGEAILFNGLNTGISGMTIATRYFLSTSNGLITATAPVAAGNIEQALGIALAANLFYFKTDLDFIQH